MKSQNEPNLRQKNGFIVGRVTITIIKLFKSVKDDQKHVKVTENSSPIHCH